MTKKELEKELADYKKLLNKSQVQCQELLDLWRKSLVKYHKFREQHYFCSNGVFMEESNRKVYR